MLFSVSLSWAENNPPAPTTLTARTAGDGELETSAEEDCNGLPTCPLDFPINNNIIILVIGGLTLGATVIYKNHTKKASV